MRPSLRRFIVASFAAAALGLGCSGIPERDAPGGILSGDELYRNRQARGVVLDYGNTPNVAAASVPMPATMPAAPAPDTGAPAADAPAPAPAPDASPPAPPQ